MHDSVVQTENFNCSASLYNSCTCSVGKVRCRCCFLLVIEFYIVRLFVHLLAVLLRQLKAEQKYVQVNYFKHKVVGKLI